MVRVGVIGAGHLGNFHIKNLLSLDGKKCNFIGFYDIDQARSEEISNLYKIKKFNSLNSLLDSCDAVFIIIPTISHFKVALEAAKQKKHIFVEKPFTVSIEEADQIIELCKKHKRILQIGHIERFNPALTSIDQKKIRPLFLESHRITTFVPRGLDVTVIPQLMIHDIDLILTLAKSPISEISASGTPVLSDTIDIANARIKFESGCVANITSSRVSTKNMRKLRIFQKDNYISIDFLKNKSQIYSLNSENSFCKGQAQAIAEFNKPDNQGQKIWLHQPQTIDQNPMLEEQKAFLNSIKTGTQPLVTGEDGKQALEVSIKIESLIKKSLENIKK